EHIELRAFFVAIRRPQIIRVANEGNLAGRAVINPIDRQSLLVGFFPRGAELAEAKRCLLSTSNRSLKKVLA
ncbi:hypothetical protein, partial [Brucella intermedia]|uniref:hypothetical protein n=1 Tax=Brucella intermedia TaxID=94625 RepID=UPI00235E6967